MTKIDVDRHIAEMEEDGYTILRDVLPESELEAARKAIQETLAAEEPVAKKFGLQTEDLSISFNAQGKHPFFYGFMIRNPEPMELARRLMGEEVFAHDIAIRVPMPTGRKDHTRLAGHVHVDWHQFTVWPFQGGKHYPMAAQALFCISDFSEETGGTIIWPGSHKWAEVPPEDFESTPSGWIVAEAPAGSVIMLNSGVWHTGGINRSDGPRDTLISYFQRWWIRGYNDSYHLVSAEVRAALSDEERHSWGMDIAYPPNTHLRGMSEEELAALSPEDKAVLNIPAYL